MKNNKQHKATFEIWPACDDFLCRREFSVTCYGDVDVSSQVVEVLENVGKPKISARVSEDQEFKIDGGFFSGLLGMESGASATVTVTRQSGLHIWI